MNILYSLHVLTEIMFNEYDSVVDFSIGYDSLKVRIKTVKGKVYNYGIDIMHVNEVQIQEWLDKIPELFRQSLVDEALGKPYRELEGSDE